MHVQHPQDSILKSKRFFLAVSAVAAIAFTPGWLGAQRSLPFAEDALVLGFGQVRAGFHGSWEFYDQLYSENGSVVSLGEPLSFQSAGRLNFPALAPYENAIRDVSTQSAFQLSLGTTSVNATHRTGSTSLLLDVGLPGRLMISAEVPFVRVEVTSTIAANAGVNPANVGVNPAATNATIFAADTSLANQITRARNSLSAQLTSCAGSTASSCAAVNARRSEAQALVASSATLSAGILVLASSPVAPLASSATQAAITARIAATASSYRDFGITTITGTTVAPAALPLTGGQYRDFLASDLGLSGSVPSYRALTRLGDISLTAKFRIADIQRIRAAAFGRVFLPTGGTPSRSELLAVTPGEGTTRAEVGGIVDFFVREKFFVTASGSSLLNSGDAGRAGFNFALTPGYAVNKWLSVGGQYRSRHLGDATENRIGAGISFSNLSASRESGPRFPVEASFFHAQSISGSGLHPRIFSDEIRIRIFARR